MILIMFYGAGRVCMGCTGVSARQNLYLHNFKEKPSCTWKVFIFLVVLFSYVTNYKERLNTLRKTTSNMRLKPLEVRWVLTSENFADSSEVFCVPHCLSQFHIWLRHVHTEQMRNRKRNISFMFMVYSFMIFFACSLIFSLSFHVRLVSIGRKSETRFWFTQIHNAKRREGWENQ